MIQKIKMFILSSSALTLLVLPALMVPLAGHAGAADANPQEAVCYGATHLQIAPDPSTGNCPSGADQTTGVNNILTEAINVFSVLVGVISVIMIIVGGFHYITSGGSQEKVKKAKDTLIYAIIGLIVVALAQIIVKFVLGKSTNAVSGS